MRKNKDRKLLLLLLPTFTPAHFLLLLAGSPAPSFQQYLTLYQNWYYNPSPYKAQEKATTTSGDPRAREIKQQQAAMRGS